MKKLVLILLAAVMLLSLCACGADVPEGDGDLMITAKPKTENTTEDTTVPEETTAEVTEDTTAADAGKKALAESCVGKNVSELYELIGQPNSSDYAPSCLVDGEDGMLYYDGFVVYTTREGDVETVYYVE